LVFWPNMTSEIKDYIRNCEACQTYQNSQRKEPLIPIIATRPWEIIGIDLFEIDGKNFLITVDYYSNFFEID